MADGANALLSLFRAFVSDPDRRGHHLQNAAISAASMVPLCRRRSEGVKLARPLLKSKGFQKGMRMVGEKGKLAKERRLAEGLESIVSGPKADGSQPSDAEQRQRQEEHQRAVAAATIEEADNSDRHIDALERDEATARGGSRKPKGIWGALKQMWRTGTGNDQQEAAEEEKAKAEQRRGLTEQQENYSKQTDSFKRLLDATGAVTLGLGVLAAKAVDWANSYVDENNRMLNRLRPLEEYNGQIRDCVRQERLGGHEARDAPSQVYRRADQADRRGKY